MESSGASVSRSLHNLVLARAHCTGRQGMHVDLPRDLGELVGQLGGCALQAAALGDLRQAHLLRGDDGDDMGRAVGRAHLEDEVVARAGDRNGLARLQMAVGCAHLAGADDEVVGEDGIDLALRVDAHDPEVPCHAARHVHANA